MSCLTLNQCSQLSSASNHFVKLFLKQCNSLAFRCFSQAVPPGVSMMSGVSITGLARLLWWSGTKLEMNFWCTLMG